MSYRCATSGGCGLQTSPSSLRLLQRAAEWSPSRWLLALGIPFGLAFALVTPPLQAPDEMPHLARALAISEGTLGAEAFVDGKPSIRVPQSFVALPGRLGTGLQMHAERRQDPALIARELARPQRTLAAQLATAPECLQSDRLSAPGGGRRSRAHARTAGPVVRLRRPSRESRCVPRRDVARAPCDARARDATAPRRAVADDALSRGLALRGRADQRARVRVARARVARGFARPAARRARVARARTRGGGAQPREAGLRAARGDGARHTGFPLRRPIAAGADTRLVGGRGARSGTALVRVHRVARAEPPRSRSRSGRDSFAGWRRIRWSSQA